MKEPPISTTAKAAQPAPTPAAPPVAPPPVPPAAPSWTIKDAEKLYNIQGWGQGYFRVNADGHVAVHPGRDPKMGLDLFQLALDLEAQGVRLPLLVRFSDILKSRLEMLADLRYFSLMKREADIALRLGRPNQDTGAAVLARHIGTISYEAYAPAGSSVREAAALPWLSYDESMAQVPQATYRRALECIVTFDRRANLPAIPVPTLLVAGEFDRNAPPAVMKKMAGAIPHATYLEMKGIGHLMQLEAPDDFDGLVMNFLALPRVLD